MDVASYCQNLTSNYTISGSTQHESASRTVQNGTMLWRQLCSMKSLPTEDDNVYTMGFKFNQIKFHA